MKYVATIDATLDVDIDENTIEEVLNKANSRYANKEFTGAVNVAQVNTFAVLSIQDEDGNMVWHCQEVNMDKVYLVCGLNDENYTEAWYEVHKTHGTI